MSNDIDTLLYYNSKENYVEESRYEKDLSNIRSEMDLKLDSIKLLLKNNTVLENDHFHIIVGSFSVESNAFNYSKKIKSLGYDGNIIAGKNGLDMVTTKSYNNLRIAIGDLTKIHDSVTPNAWIYISK